MCKNASGMHELEKKRAGERGGRSVGILLERYFFVQNIGENENERKKLFCPMVTKRFLVN